MGLQDYTYRIKAQSGDTTIHDELAVSGDMSGGTQTLVDMGSGDYAWQIASGRASVAVPSKTFDPNTTGSGVTIAVRLAITSYDASSFAFLAGWATDAASTPTKGLCLGQNGTNVVRSRWIDTSADTLSMLTVNNAVRTYVLRATSPASGLEKVYAWVSGVTGSGDTADYISSGQNYTSTDLDTAFLGSSGSTVRVSDFVIWPEELTDAQCHALAENGIRATLDTGGSATVTHSATLGAVTQSFSASVAAGVVLTHSSVLGAITQSFSATLAPGTTLSQSATLGAVTGSMVIFDGATITSPPIKRNNGSLVASATLSWVSILDGATGVQLGVKTGITTDAAGRLAVRDDGMTPGGTYALDWLESTGERGHGWGVAT